MQEDDFEEKLKSLEVKASNAHSCEWVTNVTEPREDGTFGVEDTASPPDLICSCSYRHEAAFIAEANPAFVTEMIKRIRNYEKMFKKVSGKVLKDNHDVMVDLADK